MRKPFAMALFIIQFAVAGAASWAQTNYVVDQAGGAGVDFTDVNALITAINASADTEFAVQFTDTSAATYNLVPVQQSIGEGKTVDFTATQADTVKIDGRLNVANAGGRFSATRMIFSNSGRSGDGADRNLVLHAYDGLTLNNCTIGDAVDNGIIVGGGVLDNVLNNCTFRDIMYAGFRTNNGHTTLNNCTWVNSGFIAVSEFLPEIVQPGLGFTVEGGSAARPIFGTGFILKGGNIVVNNFSVDGYQYVLTRDFESEINGSAGTLSATNCTFTNFTDRAISFIKKSPDSEDKPATITVTNCYFESHPQSVADVCVMDGKGLGSNGTIVIRDSILRQANTTGVGTVAASFLGGSIIIQNSVLIGAGNGALSSSEGQGATTLLDMDHCVIVEASEQAIGAGDQPMTEVVVRNTVIDASNVTGINAAGENTVATIEYNLINVAGESDGTNIATGEPMFVSRATDDYHIQPGSACIGMGVATALDVDIDGQLYAASAPDIGIDQIPGADPINRVGGHWTIMF